MTGTVNSDELATFESWDQAVLAPIVLPLTLALVAQIVAAYSLWSRHRGGTDRAEVTLASGAVLVVEFIMGFACWVQCIGNYHERNFWGAEVGCDTMAFYIAWWWLAALGCTLNCALVARAAALGSPLPPVRRQAIYLAAVMAVSLIFGCLGLTTFASYRYAQYFCMPDAEGAVYGWLFIIVAAIALVLVGSAYTQAATHGPPLARRFLLFPTLMVFFNGVIVAISIGARAGLDLDHEAGRDIYSYDSLAIASHTQQLVYPLVYSMVWNRWLGELLAVEPAKPVALVGDGIPATV